MAEDLDRLDRAVRLAGQMIIAPMASLGTLSVTVQCSIQVTRLQIAVVLSA
jgi:hypothetical protein